MKKKRVNGCAKGKAQEREACHLLTRLGFPTERNARNGKSEPDLVTPFVNVHLEIKSVKKMGLGTVELTAACDQAKRDAAANERRAWAVLWKEYKKGWRLTYAMLRNQMVVDDQYRDEPTFVYATVAGDEDIAAMLRFLERH